MNMEIRKSENSVLKLLNGYTKKEVVEIVEGLFKAKQADCGRGYGYGGKKRGLEEDEEQPPVKKKLNNGIMDSLKAHIHPFLESRPPPKLKIMSFTEAIANLPNPNLNQKTTRKATHRCPPRSRTTLPLNKAASKGRRSIKITASALDHSNTRSKIKSSISKKETLRVPQIPRRISRDLHEHQAAPASKLPAVPLQASAASEQSTICSRKAVGNSIPGEISSRRAASEAQDHKQFGRASNNVKHKKEDAAAQPMSTHSQTTLPLSQAAGNSGRRPTKISASASDHSNTRSESKPSISQKETSPVLQIPRRISHDLHEHQAAASKLPALPLKVSASEQSTTTCFGKEGGSSNRDEISPRRAERATELKTRFAAIISKAQDHKWFSQASTNVKHKEEAATQLKSIRQREREAARLALDKVEEAADGRDNMQIFEEFQALCTCDLQKYPNGFYPLEQFGLILRQ